MITTTILNLFYSVIQLILSPIRLLPEATLPASTAQAIATAGTYIKAVDFVLPVPTLLTVIGLILGIEAGILIYKIIYWVIKKIPTIS